MTSNQVAYAGVKLGEAQLEEDKRWHDMQKEIQDRTLQLEQEKVQIDSSYKSQKLALDKQWNEFQEEIQSETFVWTKEAQDRELNIKQQYKDLESWYKQASIENEVFRRTNEEKKIEEEKRHNQQMEAISKYGNIIEDKKIKYQYYALDTESGIRWADLKLKEQSIAVDRLKVGNEYALGLMNVGLQQRKNNILQGTLDLENNKWETNKKLAESGNVNTWTRTIAPFFIPSMDAVLGTASRVFSSLW